jgi:hypothetical protein
MRRTLSIVSLVFAVCILHGARGETCYVNGSAPEFGDGSSEETPLETIQEGIEAASDGDTVIVAEGTYSENIRLEGKNIVLRSEDPTISTVVENTIIDGRQDGPVVTFDGTEDETCALWGLTIQNGRAEYGAGILGGTYGGHTRARIEGNIIVGNTAAVMGGGLAFCDGVIRRNTIKGNSSQRAGGLYCCDGIISENTITGNVADVYGGGALGCDGRIERNVISANSSNGGGGLFLCDGFIGNNLVVGNHAGADGGGIELCNGIICNNTIVHNSAAGGGGGLAWAGGHVMNCIIWGNTAPTDPQVYLWWREPAHSYSYVGGDPRFVDPDGPDDDPTTYEDNDYRLLPDSPCIDAGKNEDWMWQAIDLDNNPRILQGSSSMSVDIGACEYFPTPMGTTWHVDGSASAFGDGSSWDTPLETMQEGIDAASDGDTVLVAPGIYVENINFDGKNIVLRSSDLAASLSVSSTVIDGNQSGSVVTFSGKEDETCLLSGFTIRNGNAESGGGIFGQGLGIEWTQARIENNVITGNSAQNGGGLSKCAGPILNNTICGNQAEQGSATYYCGGVVRNCVIWGNTGGDQFYRASIPAYSCVEGGARGEGNTASCPNFVDEANSDYHLQSWSPCIDAGDRASLFSEEPWPNGERINMGAYGNTLEAASKCPDSDRDGLADDWETEFFGSLDQGKAGDPDEDLLSNVHEYYRGTDPGVPQVGPVDWYVDRSVKTSGDGSSGETAFKTIQEGIDAASHGDTVIVAQGTYGEQIHFGGMNITLRSTDPKGSEVVSSTIIDGSGKSGGVVVFSGTEGSACLVTGFTIQNGTGVYGGGICGGSSDTPSHATIRENIVENNSADFGAGLIFCDGRVEGNIITGNSATWLGGGFFCCNGMIQSNVISLNRSERYGGGLWYSNAVTYNNLFAENSTEYAGGACALCYGFFQNNTIVGNSTTSSSATGGGGLAWCHGIILNCIIWGNTSSTSPQMCECDEPTYSCIQDWWWGEGNISDDPRFVNSTEGDYHLSRYSPCIDVGKNEDWMLDAVDLDGNPRLMDGDGDEVEVVDIGAYEFPESIPPEITLQGDNPLTLECGTPYVEPGYTAIDNYDGDITANVVVTGVVDHTWPGTYALTYNVTDSSGNPAEPKQRVVYVEDTIPPVITLLGDNPMTLQVGTPYEEPGYTATDACDGDITADVEVTGLENLDHNTPGSYELRYNVSDSEGNAAEERVRTIIVVESAPFEIVQVMTEGPEGTCELAWNSRPGTTYTVWSCFDLVVGPWIEEATILADAETTTWTDLNTTCMCKFYRIERSD